MSTIKDRCSIIRRLQHLEDDLFLAAETTAFHGRKIVECIAFGCLVRLENGLRQVPSDANGKWKADEIFKSIEAKGLGVALPSPSIIRAPTKDELAEFGSLGSVIEGQADRRPTSMELYAIYARLHKCKVVRTFLRRGAPWRRPSR